MTMKKVIVLGATGQLGAYTSVALKEQGYDVVAVGHRVSDNGFFNTKGIEYIGGFSLEKAADYDKLPTDADALVHLAGTMPAHADASPMPYVQSIVVGMVNLCEWLKTTSCRRVVFNTTPSDVAAFFGTDVAVPNDAPRSFPKDGGDHAVYAIAKNAAVDILEHYKYSDGISSCVFRHLTVYGFHPDPFYNLNGVKKMLPWRYIVSQAMQGNTIEVWGDPSRKKELLYIKDFTSAVVCALRSGAEGIYNLSGDKPYSLEEQIDGIIEVFSPEQGMAPKVYCPDNPDTPQNLLDSSVTNSKLGWHQEYSWRDACADIRRDMQEQPYALLWGRSENFE